MCKSFFRSHDPFGTKVSCIADLSDLKKDREF